MSNGNEAKVVRKGGVVMVVSSVQVSFLTSFYCYYCLPCIRIDILYSSCSMKTLSLTLQSLSLIIVQFFAHFLLACTAAHSNTSHVCADAHILHSLFLSSLIFPRTVIP